MPIEELPQQPNAELRGEGSNQPLEEQSLPTAPKQNPDREGLLTLAAELKNSVRRDQRRRLQRRQDSL